MTIFIKRLAGGLGLAAIAAATPAAAQYGYSQYGNSYGNPYQSAYGSQYGNSYGAYGDNNLTQVAAQQCSAAVQNRLSTRGGLAGILGAVLGNRSSGGRVLSITRVEPRYGMVRVRGLANSGDMGQYGYGAYGAAAYAYQPDLSFTCNVDLSGRVRGLNISRRR